MFTSGFKDFLEGFKENWIGDRTVTVTELVPLVLRVFDLIIDGYVFLSFPTCETFAL